MITFRTRFGRFVSIGLLLGFGLLGCLTGASAGPDDDDPEEREFLRATARRAVLENCTICHSSDLIVSQRLTGPQWKAEVEKMIGWGSPLPKDDQSKVVAYLAEEYAVMSAPLKVVTLSLRVAIEPEGPETRPEARTLGLTIAASVLSKGQKAFVRDCANCHGINGQGAELGPNLVEKPILSRPSEFSKIIVQGNGRMPAFGKRIDLETNMIAWLRSLRYIPPPLTK